MSPESSLSPNISSYELPNHSNNLEPLKSLDFHFNEIEARKKFDHEALDIFPKEILRRSEHIQNPTDLNLINTRLWINELSKKYDKKITIGSVPEKEWKELFDRYDAFWFMGIYKPSVAGRQLCQKYPESVRYAKKDVNPETDIVASPFAIPEYTPNPNIAKDWEEWDKVVDYLHQNGKKVFLDFVPNHTALDHPWSINRPDFFIQGTDEQKQKNPSLYCDITDKDGQVYHLAHGKDPNCAEWADTLQLNYANPDLQEAMRIILLGNDNEKGLVNHCDGVRCDMAMLVNYDKFINTWGDKYHGGHLSRSEINYLKDNAFWPKIIPEVKAKAKELAHEDFTFIAEVYEDKDLEDLTQHFDYLYRKNFYDDLIKAKNKEISHDCLRENIKYIIESYKKGHKFVLFTENHDEDRSINAFGSKEAAELADVRVASTPGIFLVCQGQTDGLKIRIPMQLDQPLEDPKDPSVQDFWDRLLKLRNSRLYQEGEWSVLPPNSNTDSRIVVQKCSLNSYSLYVCTNDSDQTVYGYLDGITKNDNVKACDLIQNKTINDFDQSRENDLFFLKIEKGGVQLVLVDRKPKD